MDIKEEYSVDRINDSIVILINNRTNEIVEERKENLPLEIYDGCILIKDSYYKIDKNKEKKRRINIRNRFNNLKNK